MPYLPGASALAATHRGKLKNIRLSTLRDTQITSDPRSSILQFEKESVGYDKIQKKETQGIYTAKQNVYSGILIFYYVHVRLRTTNTNPPKL